MSFQKPVKYIVLSFAAVLGVEILIHWALGNNLSPTVRRLYLSDSKLSSVTMSIDAYIPAAILGFVNGWFGKEWTTRVLNITAIVIAGALTGSEVLYSLFFPTQLLWWWPPRPGEAIFWFLTTAIFSLFFSYFGRNLRQAR